LGEQPEGAYTLVMGATTYRLIEHDAAEHFSVGSESADHCDALQRQLFGVL